MHLGALWAKAQRWQEEDPPVAIEIYHSIFKIDRKGMAATLVEELERRLETGLVDDEDMLAVEELMERERQKYRDDERDQLSVLDAGKGATRLWNLHLGLIKAYRRAGRPADAYRACLRVLKDESKGQSDHDVMTLRYISYELSKSSLRLGEFEEAIQVAHHLLVADRSMPGVHKVVATALLALDQERQEENVSGEVVVEMESDGYVYYANLDCAIEVMYEGFAYEEHWNDRNTYTNREFLKLLCDLNGVEVTVTHFETQQPERATNRWKEKRRSRKRK